MVRLSALGDIVHALPALTDLRRAHPQAVIDVAVDARFADIPRLHAGVDHVIALPIKHWKQHLLEGATWRGLLAQARELRQVRYDLVIDLHGLNKSAIVAWLARGAAKLGPAPELCGEGLAPHLYDRHLQPSGPLEPVPRMRALMGLALARPPQGEADFGLRMPWSGAASRQVALVHNTSALRLADGIGAAHCVIGPRQSVAEWAVQLSACRLVIGVDTGLTHLAAAAGVPCLALFVVTDASLFAPQHPGRACALGGSGVPAGLEEACRQAQRLLRPPVTAPADPATPASQPALACAD